MINLRLRHMFRDTAAGTCHPVPTVISYALADRKRHALGIFTDLMQMYSFVLSREDRSAIWRVHGPDELAGYTDPDGLPAYYLQIDRTLERHPPMVTPNPAPSPSRTRISSRVSSPNRPAADAG
jgi:hypothetical protein